LLETGVNPIRPRHAENSSLTTQEYDQAQSIALDQLLPQFLAIEREPIDGKNALAIAIYNLVDVNEIYHLGFDSINYGGLSSETIVNNYEAFRKYHLGLERIKRFQTKVESGKMAGTAQDNNLTHIARLTTMHTIAHKTLLTTELSAFSSPTVYIGTQLSLICHDDGEMFTGDIERKNEDSFQDQKELLGGIKLNQEEGLSWLNPWYIGAHACNKKRRHITFGMSHYPEGLPVDRIEQNNYRRYYWLSKTQPEHLISKLYDKMEGDLRYLLFVDSADFPPQLRLPPTFKKIMQQLKRYGAKEEIIRQVEFNGLLLTTIVAKVWETYVSDL